MKRKKKVLSVIKQVLFVADVVLTLLIGLSLYLVFWGYAPGVNINDLFVSRLKIGAFQFIGISAGILITLPVLIAAIAIYIRFIASYVSYQTEIGIIHLSDASIESFITDVVSQITGVESVEVAISIYKENGLGINIWLDTDEKSDFVRFSERVQQRVLQDLDFNFGIKKIRYFHVYIESTNINAGGTGYKVNYN